MVHYNTTNVRALLIVAITMIIPSLNILAASSSSIFVRQSQPKFSGNASSQQLGASVALSRDGKLAVVGAPSAFGGVGFVYTYQRQGGIDSHWVPLGSNETALEPLDAVGQGTSLALSSDGLVLAVGAPDDGSTQGLVRIYSRNINDNNNSEPLWTLQQTLENPSNQLDVGGFGTSLAMTDDASTLVVGAIGEFGSQGGAFVYSRSSTQSEFQRFGPKLIGTNSQGSSNQGYSTAISNGNGKFVAVGGPDDAFGSGAVWMFTRESDRFVQMGRKLTVGFDSDNFGFSVELSNDGKILLVGAPFRFPRGAVFMYRLNNDGTSYQQVQQLNVATCSTNCMFGFSVALAEDATRVAIGAPFHNTGSTGAGLIGTTFLFERQGASGNDDRFVLSQNLTGTVANSPTPDPTSPMIQDLEMNQETRAINQGFSVAIASNNSSNSTTVSVVVLVGAPEEGFNSEGSVRFFESDSTNQEGPRRGLLQRQFGYRNLLAKDQEASQSFSVSSVERERINNSGDEISSRPPHVSAKGRLKIVTKVIHNITNKLKTNKKQSTRD